MHMCTYTHTSSCMHTAHKCEVYLHIAISDEGEVEWLDDMDPDDDAKRLAQRTGPLDQITYFQMLISVMCAIKKSYLVFIMKEQTPNSTVAVSYQKTKKNFQAHF